MERKINTSGRVKNETANRNTNKNGNTNGLLLFESTADQQTEETKSKSLSRNSGADKTLKKTSSSQSDKSSSESSESDDTDDSSSSSSGEENNSKGKNKTLLKSKKKSEASKQSYSSKKKQNENSTNLDLLLSLADDVPPSLPSGVLSPSLGGLLTPSEANASDNTGSNMSPVIESKPNFISTESSELLNRISTGGLQLLYR